MTTVLVIDPNAERYAESLRETCPQATFLLAGSEPEAEPHLAEAEVLMAIGHGLTRETIGRMERLRWVQALITGTDHFEHVLAGRPDVLLTSARGIHGPQMTEMVVLHMLALSRDVRRLVHQQDEHRWQRFEQKVLDGRTVGIVGIGVVGAHLARVCKALGMTVHAVSRTPRQLDCVDRFFERSQLPEAAAGVDFLVLTLPHESDSDKLVDAAVFRAMKPSAYLINVARGRVVDERALVEALRSGEIAGAGLDVFEETELSPESPLWEMPNVFVTPWLAGHSDRYVERALTVVEPNLRHYLAGERDRIVNVVER